MSLFHLSIVFNFRSLDWLFISNSMKKYLFFPKLLFKNVKSVEKQSSYGARSSEYYWMIKNMETHNFEYYEILKVTSYCQLGFSTFPFDAHKCDVLIGSSLNAEQVLRINKPLIIHKAINSKNKIIPIESENVPFNMEAISIEPFFISMNGYNYSYTGLGIYFKRSELGLLIGRFYVPTAAFSALSMLSYNINIDMVQLAIIYNHAVL